MNRGVLVIYHYIFVSLPHLFARLKVVAVSNHVFLFCAVCNRYKLRGFALSFVLIPFSDVPRSLSLHRARVV